MSVCEPAKANGTLASAGPCILRKYERWATGCKQRASNHASRAFFTCRYVSPFEAFSTGSCSCFEPQATTIFEWKSGRVVENSRPMPRSLPLATMRHINFPASTGLIFSELLFGPARNRPPCVFVQRYRYRANVLHVRFSSLFHRQHRRCGFSFY